MARKIVTESTILFLFLVTIAAAQFPGGLTSPHIAGSGNGQGTILDTPPFTPGYHNGETLICSDCHIMHASMQHNYGYNDIYNYPLQIDPPQAKLLKAGNALSLCLSCHQDKTGIPDVIGPDINGGTMRAAGQFANVGERNNMGHSLDPNPGDLCTRCHYGGDMSTASVQCIDCHAPHGTGYYRNLQWASAPGQEPPIIAFTRSGVSGLDKYQAANIDYGCPGDGRGQPTWREVTNVCIDCHHSLQDGNPPYNNYWTNPDGDTFWNRHPGTNSEGGAYRPINGQPGENPLNTDPAHWTNGQGPDFSIGRLPFLVKEAHNFDAASVVAADNEVFCLSCHQVHGTDKPFALRWAYGDDQDNLTAAGCRQCHNNVIGNIP